MITFIARMTVRPENDAAFEALIARVRDMSRVQEPGVLYYDFARSVERAGEYVVIEVYRDEAAHAAHMKADWVTRSIPLSRELVEGEIDVRKFVNCGPAPAWGARSGEMQDG